MYDFIFFTKTFWNEPPRIRHQLAWLLESAGYNILFFEKPSHFLKKIRSPTTVKERITVVEHKELIHHKLRLFPLIHRLNAAVTISSIRATLRRSIPISRKTKIVNFNYEYFFLRCIFPDNKIITVINDDHTASALFRYEAPLNWALSQTCKISDHVLVVSTPLQKKLSRFTNAKLFFPWADILYKTPSRGLRNILLFWGNINYRIDFKMLIEMADKLASINTDFKILLVGPIAKQYNNAFAKLVSRKNVEFRPPSKLDELPIDKVLAGIIPYKEGDKKIDAIEISNKSLQLLARGLPLIISGMPNFIKKPFVLRAHSHTILEIVYNLNHQFHDLQTNIRDFVEQNSGQKRLQQFMKFFN